MPEPKITLKAARVNAGLKRDEVAERIGKSEHSIINWETGRTPINYRDLLKLSELYDMPVEYIKIPEGE